MKRGIFGQLIGCILISIRGVLLVGQSNAQTDYYKPAEKGEVIKIIDNIQKNNPIVHSIFEQKVRTYSQGNAIWFGSKNRIANGVWILTMSISPYLQWVIFIGMTLSALLIIYNGFMIMANAGDDSQIKSAKDNIKHIIIGVFILGGVFAIMKLISSLLINLLGG